MDPQRRTPGPQVYENILDLEFGQDDKLGPAPASAASVSLAAQEVATFGQLRSPTVCFTCMPHGLQTQKHAWHIYIYIEVKCI